MNINFVFDTDKLFDDITAEHEFVCSEEDGTCLYPDRDGCENCVVFDSVIKTENLVRARLENNLENYLHIENE